MKRIIVILVIVIAAAASLHHGHAQPLMSVVNDKDIQNSLPDPNRPYFDGCGNKFDYQGNLLEAGTGCVADVPPLDSSFEGK